MGQRVNGAYQHLDCVALVTSNCSLGQILCLETTLVVALRLRTITGAYSICFAVANTSLGVLQTTNTVRHQVD